MQALQAAVKHAGESDWREGYALYKQYSDLQHGRNPIDVRDFLAFHYDGHTVPVEEVESLHTILWRFSTAAMSHGALSAEAHATLSIGDESPERAEQFRRRRRRPGALSAPKPTIASSKWRRAALA